MSQTHDTIDSQPTMNVARAHSAAARENTVQPTPEGRISNLPLILSAIVFVFAGGFIGSNIGAQKSERPKSSGVTEYTTPPDVKWLKDGASVYSSACQGCHQPNGMGNPSAGIPPLDGSEWVLVLKGLQGPVTVKGVSYGTAVMNAKGGVSLTDKQVAQALSYVRNTWSNKGSFVMDDQIKAHAAEIASLASPTSIAEVEKIPATEMLAPSKKPIVPGGAAPAAAAPAPAPAAN